MLPPSNLQQYHTYNVYKHVGNCSFHCYSHSTRLARTITVMCPEPTAEGSHFDTAGSHMDPPISAGLPDAATAYQNTGELGRHGFKSFVGPADQFNTRGSPGLRYADGG